jgi:hypothetical protein
VRWWDCRHSLGETGYGFFSSLLEEPNSELGKQGARLVIAGMDGSMVPIVSTKTDEKGREIKGDKRKHRELGWEEARLCVARDPRSVSGHYRATMGDVEQAGLQLVGCVAEAGGGNQLNCTVWQTTRRGSCRRSRSGSQVRQISWWTSTM